VTRMTVDLLITLHLTSRRISVYACQLVKLAVIQI
jgi:hypothetical protein